MRCIVEYIKNFVVLFLILMLLVQLVPGEKFQKYVRFFSEIVLLIGVMYPMLDALGESDSFLDKIEFEAFTETLSEVSKDAEKIAYMQNDYYMEQFENMMELDVTEQVENLGYEALEVEVSVSTEYKVKSIKITVKEKESEEIAVEKITVSGADRTDMIEEDLEYQKLKEKLVSYYELSEQQLSIVCE